MTKKRRLIYQINLARHAMMKYLDAGSREALGVSATQLTALMTLRENNGLLMKELADVLMLDKSAVTGLAKRMVANDLIVRVPSENDARASFLTVTTKGNEKLELGLKLLKGVNKQMSEGFTEDELVIVSRFLEHITSTFASE